LVNFALNHMTTACASYGALLDVAHAVGCVGIEIRNDLPGELFDGQSAQAAGQAAKDRGLRILSLAEVAAFDDFSDQKREQARRLIDLASACGAEAISLIPRNDGIVRNDRSRLANLRLAIDELKPMLQAAHLAGLIEPLGFAPASLRSKAEAVDLIEAAGAAGQFKLVHDTFHHHLAGGGSFFPEHTGIMHISGVDAPQLAVTELRDEHRELVDAHDRLGNLAQINSMRLAGYTGPISVEAFSPDVHAFTDPATKLGESFDYITSFLAAAAA